MLILFTTLLTILTVLVCADRLWRKKLITGEEARKLVHITFGAWVAFWPLYISWWTIRFILVFAVAFILLVRYFKWFRSIYDVKRSSYGDLIYPLTIAALTFITTSKFTFGIVVLHLALADGMAAVVGKRYGKSTRYKMLDQDKSLIGNLVFFAISVVITMTVFVVTVPHNTGLLVMLPVLATLAETVGVYGLDNFFVPLTVLVVLRVSLPGIG